VKGFARLDYGGGLIWTYMVYVYTPLLPILTPLPRLCMHADRAHRLSNEHSELNEPSLSLSLSLSFFLSQH
jgi:hypothetical protein